MANSRRQAPVEIERSEVGGWFEEVDGGYNPADFVLPATDHQGHSDRFYFRAQPQLSRALSLAIASKKFPFRTSGDLMRWAVVRGVKVLDRLDPMPGLLGVVDAIDEILRQEMYMQEIKQMFVRMEAVIHQHIASGANGEARKLLAVVLHKISQIDEPHWRKMCDEDVRRRFGHLLQGPKKANLRGGEEDHG